MAIQSIASVMIFSPALSMGLYSVRYFRPKQRVNIAPDTEPLIAGPGAAAAGDYN